MPATIVKASHSGSGGPHMTRFRPRVRSHSPLVEGTRPMSASGEPLDLVAVGVEDHDVVRLFETVVTLVVTFNAAQCGADPDGLRWFGWLRIVLCGLLDRSRRSGTSAGPTEFSAVPRPSPPSRGREGPPPLRSHEGCLVRGCPTSKPPGNLPRSTAVAPSWNWFE